MGQLSLQQGPKPTKTASRVSFTYKPSQGPRGWGRPQGDGKQKSGLRLVKFHMGPDTLIIVMRLCFCDSTGLGKLFSDRDQKVTGPGRNSWRWED